MGKSAESQTGTTLQALLRDPMDPEAWKVFVERYTPKVLGWCRQWHLQTADAEDVTQEVLYKLARQIHRFPYDPAKGRFRGWLKTLTLHAWCDLRDSRRRAGWGSGDPHVQQLLDEQQDGHTLAEALDEEFRFELYEEAKARVRGRVSEETWQAFRLLVEAGWSGTQVAAHLQLKVTTVYQAKHRVQTMLAEEIHQLEESGVQKGESPT
jgi:RNA polymerase sigma-70 factor (ECF subfamily)